MSKQVDTNGFWKIEHNPISKVGVFPYLGSQISDECEPNKIYHVFRSAETLKASVPTWDNPPKPFIDDHEMLGEGFTNVDDRPVQGIIYNPVFDEETGILYADMAIYSEEMKEKIANGKKEISLGYFCKYRKESGVYNGEVYDFVQVDMVGNHGALVDAGRCGSDVKVFDSALRTVFDAMPVSADSFVLYKNTKIGKIITKDLNITKGLDMKYVRLDEVDAILKKGMSWGDEENPTQKLISDLLAEKAIEGVEPVKETATDADVDKREAIRKIMAIAARPNDDFDGGEEEKIETIAKLLEESEYNKSESGDEADEEKEKKSEDADCLKEIQDALGKIAQGVDKLLAAKDEDESEKDKPEPKAEDEDDKDSEEEPKKSEDAAVVVIGNDSALASDEDPALVEYLK